MSTDRYINKYRSGGICMQSKFEPELRGFLQDVSKPAATDDTVAAAVQGWNEMAQSFVSYDEASVSAHERGDADNHSPQAIQAFFWTAWGSLLDVAAHTPHNHQDKLVDFCFQLHKLGAVEGTDGEKLACWGQSAWGGLPLLGPTIWATWNFDFDDPKTIHDHWEYNNLAAFLAQLTARSIDDANNAFDFRLYAIRDLRNLEDPPEGGICEGAVRQAAMWVCYAGEQLRKLSTEGYKDENINRMCDSIGKYKNRRWRGFNKLRWAAWHAELKAAQNELGPKRNIDPAIRLAVELMDKLVSRSTPRRAPTRRAPVSGSNTRKNLGVRRSTRIQKTT